jgi:hypothetical protein
MLKELQNFTDMYQQDMEKCARVGPGRTQGKQNEKLDKGKFI